MCEFHDSVSSYVLLGFINILTIFRAIFALTALYIMVSLASFRRGSREAHFSSSRRQNKDSGVRSLITTFVKTSDSSLHTFDVLVGFAFAYADSAHRSHTKDGVFISLGQRYNGHPKN